MWWCVQCVCAVFIIVSSSDGSADADQLAAVEPQDSSPLASSPLAQLLAAASKKSEIPQIVFPLAPVRQRNKRKPQQFRPKGQSIFRPKSLKDLQLPGKPFKHFKGESTAAIKSRFSAFSKQPRPGPVNQILAIHKISKNEEDLKTATKPTLEIEDYFGTPDSVAVPIEIASEDPPVFEPKSTIQIPLAISNSISADALYDQRELFERLQSLTGAKPVGVTRDITRPVETKEEYEDAVSRQNQARQLGDRGIVRSSGRRGARSRVTKLRRQPGPTEDHETRQELNSVEIAASIPHKKKKSKFAFKKTVKKGRVGTINRYRYENEDGSITWGYENDDGGFKEETIGIDCITHGKYGYTDPNGEKRKYSYTSGIRCHPDTRKASVSGPGSSGARGPNGHGFFDYSQNKFVMPNGRRVTVVVNQGNKARGSRY